MGWGGGGATEASFLADRTTTLWYDRLLASSYRHHIDISSAHPSVCLLRNAVHGGSQGRRRPSGLKVVPACC